MQETTRWQTATIFISSTFKDMYYERDCINREVIPVLKQFFLQYKIAVRAIDLRWGINTLDSDESDIEQSILKVCMSEIDRSRPLFVGLLGHRYGWVPNSNNDTRSVTEMEIVYGAMRDASSKCYSVFCLREPLNLPVSDSIYFENSIEKQNKVKNLRDYVCSELHEHTNHIKKYQVKWDEKEGRLYDLDDFKVYLIEQLTDIICKQFHVIKSQNSLLYNNQYIRLNKQFESYIYGIQYISRENNIEDFISQITTNQSACLIYGKGTCGKSSTLCHLYRISTNTQNTIALYYNATLSTGIHKLLELINLWNYQLSTKLDCPFEKVLYNVEVDRVFSRALSVNKDIIHASQKLKEQCNMAKNKGFNVVFYIDDVDDLLGKDFIELLRSILPMCPMILTADDKPKSLDIDSICLTPFTEGEIELYLTSRFEYYDKKLHKTVVNAINSKVKNCKGNQLWLDIVSYILLNLDVDDFRQIAATSADSEEGKIEAYFLNLIEILPVKLEELFLFVYNKCVKHFNGELVRQTLKYMSISRIGLRDCDLQELLGNLWNPIEFASFCRWFSPFIVESHDNKCWGFKSPIFSEAIRNIDLKNNAVYETNIADLLWQYDNEDPIRCSELFYHLVRCCMYDRAGKIILMESKNYANSIKLFLESLNDDMFKDVYYSLLSNFAEDRIVIACQILLHFRFDIFPNNINFGNHLLNSLLLSVDIDNDSLSEYALMALSTLLENVCHYEQIEEKIYYGKYLYHIDTIRCAKYPSEKSRSALTTSTYILANSYMRNGQINLANDYFIRLQTI